MRIKRIRLPQMIVASALLAGIVGCWPWPTSSAVLVGTWKLVPGEESNSQLLESYLTFNSIGELTKVTYTFKDEATVTWNDPPATVNVNEKDITISATRSGNGLVFDGALDSATTPTSAEGTLTFNIVIAGITVSLDRGPASLVKQ